MREKYFTFQKALKIIEIGSDAEQRNINDFKMEIVKAVNSVKVHISWGSTSLEEQRERDKTEEK